MPQGISAVRHTNGLYLLPFTFIIIIIIIIIRYHPIYNYVPQTHPVSTVRTPAAILQLQFMLHVVLFPMLNVL